MKHKIYLVLLGLLVICLNTVAQTYSIEVTNGKAFKVRGGSLEAVQDLRFPERHRHGYVQPCYRSFNPCKLHGFKEGGQEDMHAEAA